MKEQLKNNENCIQWLNKQLNEKQIGDDPYGLSKYQATGNALSTSGHGQHQRPATHQHHTSSVPGTQREALGGLRRSLDNVNLTNTKVPQYSSTPLVRNPNLLPKKGLQAGNALLMSPNVKDNGAVTPLTTKNQPSSHQNSASKNLPTPVMGLDPKYFSPSTRQPPGKQNPDVSNSSELANDYV